MQTTNKVTLSIDEKNVELLKAECNSLEGVKFESYEVETRQFVLSYKYDFNLFYLGQLFAVSKTSKQMLRQTKAISDIVKR